MICSRVESGFARFARSTTMKLGELGVMSLGMMKLGELGETSFGMMKLKELGNELWSCVS